MVLVLSFYYQWNIIITVSYSQPGRYRVPTHNRDPCPALGGLYWHIPRYVCFHSGPAIEEHNDAHHGCRHQKLSIDTKPGKVETYLLPKVLPKGYTENIGLCVASMKY